MARLELTTRTATGVLRLGCAESEEQTHTRTHTGQGNAGQCTGLEACRSMSRPQSISSAMSTAGRVASTASA